MALEPREDRTPQRGEPERPTELIPIGRLLVLAQDHAVTAAGQRLDTWFGEEGGASRVDRTRAPPENQVGVGVVPCGVSRLTTSAPPGVGCHRTAYESG